MILPRCKENFANDGFFLLRDDTTERHAPQKRLNLLTMGSAYLTVFPPSQLFFFARPQVLEPGQLQHSPPFLCLLISDITAKARASAIIIKRIISMGFM